MKKIYILVSVFIVSFAFGRVSEKHSAPASPCGLSLNSQRAEVSAFNTEDDSSLKWKRRHKKRKKTRRPQRGR